MQELKCVVIGGGLAGAEATYQLLKRGVNVTLYEMKPVKFSPAHKNPNLAELVCSNSLKSNDIFTAGGLLKEELRKLDSLVISVADECRVPAGGALAVDREKFSQRITEKLRSFKNLTIVNKEVEQFDINIPTIVATGPLTSDKLANFLQKLMGEKYYYFFDAIAPIVSANTIDMSSAFVADRYDKGDGDYINCPLNKEEYQEFHKALVEGEIVQLKDFENSKVFEGCMPIEVLAKRGEDAMRFGPLKPVGLTDPHTNSRPYAVVQLRKETLHNDLYNMVGFQTNLTYGEQKRIFSMIPALKNCEFVRFGNMHKNCFINAPKLLENYQLKSNKNIFIAGQLSGVEGYIESISSGLVCGINMYNMLIGNPFIEFDKETMIGALSYYISNADEKHFQPMSSNMGLVNYKFTDIRDKKEKNKKITENSLKLIDDVKILNNL